MGITRSGCAVCLAVAAGAVLLEAQTNDGGARAPAAGPRHVALLIGNNAYPTMPLRNAAPDARDLGAVLQAAGFATEVVVDAGQVDMERAVERFVGKVGAGDVALFFFSGHAFEMDKINYLAPVDFDANDRASARRRAYDADLLLERLDERGAKLKIVILDACRNNPFKAVRAAGGGLASMNTGRGSFIAFATAPGQTASDNPAGRNGLFTSHLMQTLVEPGLSLDQVFTRVRERVDRASSGKQIPWATSSVIGEFYFRPGLAAAGAAAPSAATSSGGAELELAFWRTVEASRDANDFEAYLRRFPNGVFTELAQRRVESLKSNAAAARQDVALAPSAAGAQRLQVRENAKDGLKYVLIPAGTFEMGCVPSDSSCSEHEKPQHRVELTKAFWLGQTEVTIAAWRRFSKVRTPGFLQSDDHPVVKVDWDKARDFCEWSGGRLPTEAEWEYAARGGRAGAVYPWAEAPTHDRANYGTDKCCKGLALGKDGWHNTSPVGSFDANGFGLFDMAGNVAEWCADGFHDNFYRSPAAGRDPLAPKPGLMSVYGRVQRGGSWNFTVTGLRISGRSWAQSGDDTTGLRCARDVAP